MTIAPELEAEITRLFHAEHWSVGTIAKQLSVHHSVVARVLQRDGVPCSAAPRASKLDSFVPFVLATLERYPRLAASRLFGMAQERGLIASEGHFRRLVARLRPRPHAEAYLRLRTLPGEQGQVDWAHFASLTVGRTQRPLLAFVIVLSYSRRIYLRFFLGAQTENFLQGHEAAFRAWGGCPRVLLYDNLKSAVLERRGQAIRFNPLLLAFAQKYRYEPRPVAVRRGNEKGRVERAIRFIRGAFFEARTFRDLDDLNAQAEEWCNGQALQRPWIDDKRLTVADAFAAEAGALLKLPDDAFPTDERREVKVGKTPYVRFDCNDYSVPHECVRQTLLVVASPTTVRVLENTNVLAEHVRSFAKHEVIEDPRHHARLVEAKREGRQHRGYDRLQRAAPATEELFQRLAERGENLGSSTLQLLRLLDEFGAASLERAVAEALQRDVVVPRAVRLILDRERRAQAEPPPVPVKLPDNPKVRDVAVTPHSLESYDGIEHRAEAPTGVAS